jgi:sugar/nucleoside kinase (ribokinase family)
MKKDINCTVMGDALIDIMFPITKPQDINYFFEGGVTSTRAKISVGGTLNIAANMAQLGGKSTFIGKIGNDCFGKFLKHDIEKNKIKDCLQISEKYNTGIVFVVVQPNKERFFLVDRGANAYLEMTDINIDLCLESKYLFISGYSFQDESTSQTVMKVIKEVADSVDIVFNPGAPNIAGTYKTQFCEIIKKYVSIVILNAKECESLIGCKDLFEEFLPYVDMVALTMGEKGSIVATKSEFHEIKADATKVVDTTGAGDAYTAGLIYGLSRKEKLSEAGHLASKLGGMVVSKVGSRWWS